MRNVMKYLGIMSVSLACAGPLFATSVQPFAGVTVVQQSVVTVKGQVVDEKGEPIIGANVIVEGTTNGMITDLDGNFSLQCPVGSTLKTSYIGYLARTVKVTGNMNALKITLKEDTETLDEVVVVGYGTMKKSDLTGSVASVNAEEMMKRNPVNLGQGLQGAAAGVSVIRSSGDPEGGFSIRIRGVATVNGSADPLYVVDGVFYSMPIVLPDGTWGHYKKEGNGDVNKGADNLVAAAKTADSINKWDRLLASAFLQLDLYKGLTFKTIASYNYYTKGYNGYTAYNDRTFGTQDRKDSFSLNQSQSTSLGLEAFLNYDWSNEHHRVSAMAGFSTSDTNGAWLNSSANDFPADNIRKISLTNDPSSKQTDGGLDLKTRFLSYFGRLTYTLNDRYIVTATVRRDGSSNFGAGNRYGTFPSASVAWRLSEEKFIKDLELFSNLKLRAGWGQTGNAGNGTNLSIAQLSSANAMYWFFNGSSVINGAGIAQQKEIDTNLKWETNEQTNIGIDFAFMNNELSFSADYFIRDAKDLLLYRQIRPSTGFSNVYTNAGHIRNSGFEFTAAWNKSFSDWNIGIRLNGSTLKNEAIEVGDPIFSKSGSAQDGDNWDNHSITQNGYPVGSYYGWKVEGIFRTQAEIDEMNRLAVEKGVESGVYQDKTTQPGDYKFVDLNGDGQITDADRTVIGNGYPKFTYGMNLTASWKNFDFSMNLYGVAGMDILSYSSARLTSVYAPDGGYQNVLKEYINNAWSSSNTGAKYPRITKTDYNKNMRVSDAYIQKGDYLKISNIQIGYTFPKNVLKPVKMENARVFASVDNVCTISSYNKFGDPEVGDSNVLYSGFDGGRYPFPMSVTFGLSVQF